jgi:3-phenylpropionate/trans-cinnamate dioxygenase ferredoxin reductase subunit
MVGSEIVIVGAGNAGAAAALGLREYGWKGQLTLIGGETRMPYERPPLSKAALTSADDPVPVPVVEAPRLDALDIRYLGGTRVRSIDRSRHTLATREHGDIPFERLVLATGAEARRPPIPGGGHVATLRTFDDAIALRQALVAGTDVAIIGGGFIGLEVAASARALGARVTVLEDADRVLKRGVPEALALELSRRHLAEGVELRTSCQITRISAEGGRYRIASADGDDVVADLVVAGVGASPRTDLASAAGLEIGNGVVVDGRLRTSDPDIFAIGDCCAFPHPLYDGRTLRLESWRNAGDQGDFVARSLLDQATEYDAVPWFWSDQYDLHLQISGLPDEGRTTVTRDLGGGARLNFHLAENGRIVATSALGPMERIAKDARIAEKLIGQRAKPDPQHLAAPERKLKALLAA